jgi:fructose-1,6-bisphosphatase/inositol monophosphatase family enzyme
VIDKVEALMREVAATVVLPRFRQLGRDDILEKSPGDIVTVADREAEARLAKGLIAILPGSLVVGEEATAADPTLMSVVSHRGAVWLVDPIDGTANFASGQEPFGVMVALLRDGVTAASWILDPMTGEMAIAERGSGAFLDGARVTVPGHRPPAHKLQGASFARYAPRDIRARLDSGACGVDRILPGHNCASYEYPAIVSDEQNFVFFWRTLPWDHAPGVLLVEEAGGVAWRLDGTAYMVGDDRHGLLVAQNQHIWDLVRSTFLARVAS